MPLFTRELNALADRIGRSDLTIWLHTAAPTEASPTNGRTTVGGAAFENGVVVASGDISTAVNGDITIPGDIDFGTADDDVGTVAWWTAVRGSDAKWDTAPCRARSLPTATRSRSTAARSTSTARLPEPRG